MATYTALMNVVVDATEASQGLNKLDKNLSSIKKSSKSTSTSLSSLEKKFNKIEKSINSAVAPIVKMQRSLDRLVGKQMSGYQKIILSLIRQNQKFSQTVQKMDKDISKLSDEINKLSKRVDTLETKLKKVGSGKTPEGLGKLTDLFKKLGNAIKRNEYILYSFSSAVLNFIKINLLGALIRLTDQYVLMENRIRLVNSQQTAFNNNMAAVKQIAQETRQSLYAIANLYSRVGRNSKELGADTIALATTVSTIAKSFQIAGATAEEARNAIVQLSQALASGRLQGDELRSILELAPTLANSIAKSIGITLGSLRSFASEGLITTSIITKAVRESAKEIDEEFKKIVPTIGQSITNIQNAFQIILGETKEIKEANEIAALSFLKLAKDIETLVGGPAMTALGKFLKDIALSIDDIIVGLTAFVAALGGLVIVGVLATLFGGLAAALGVLGVAYIAARGAINAFSDAHDKLSINIKTVDGVIEDVNKQLEDNAEKTGKAATESEKAAAQFTALKTESYNAGLQIDLFNRKLAALNEELTKLKNQGDENFFKKWGRRFLNDAFPIGNALEVLTGGDNLGDMLLGKEPESRVKELEAQVEKLKKVIDDATSAQKKIDDEVKKRRDAQSKDAQTAEEEFVRNFLNTTERTNRRLSARFQEVRDAFQDSLRSPFEIRFTPAKKALSELNDTLRQKIGDIGEKRAKGSQLEFGGVGLDVKTLRELALSGQQLTAGNLGIKDTIASMLAANKVVQDAGTAIPQVLLAEIEAATNEELLKFQEKVLAVEAEMVAALAQRTRDQNRINEGMESANKFANNELKFLKDGARLYKNKIDAINEEYYYKKLNLKEDLKGLGYLDDEIKAQVELLEIEQQRAIEAEKIAKAKSDLLYLESELDKLRSAQFELNLADYEYELLKKYNSQFDRRTMLRQEERRLLLEIKKIEWETQGLQGEKLKQAQQIFEAQQDTEDSLRRQKLLLAEALKTDQERLNFELLSRKYQSEAMNDWAERNRLDAFLMKDQIANLNRYNAEVIKATQDAGLSVDFLINDKNVLDEYGLSLLELPAKLDGVDQTLLNNLRERIEYLKEILGLENEINRRKDSDEGSSLIKLIKEFMPDANVKGTFQNEFLSNVVEFGKGQRRKKDSQAALAGMSDYVPELIGEQVVGDGGVLGGIGEIFENFAGIFEAGFDALLDTALSTYGILVKLLLAVLSNAKFQEGLNSILEPWNKMFDDIADGIGQIFQGVGALLEPLTGVFNIIGGFVRGFLRSFTRVIEPIGKLLESLQPLIIIIGAAIQSFLLIINQIFGFVGDLFDQIAEFLGGATEDGYKSLVLLKAERDVLQEIETSLDGVVDVLKKIDDVLFDIVNSSLNLAAPSIKLENAAEKYDELFEAATRFGADDQAIDEFTAFAKQFLQQSQDVLKSSKSYQDIYDRVIQDIMSVTDSFIENLGEDVTETLQKGVFDLTIVGSDLASAIDQIVDKYEDGAITFGTVADYMSYKLSQIEEDIALREVAEFGAIDIGAEFERFQEMRGAAVSSSSLSEDLDVLTSSTSNLTSAVLEAYAAFDATTDSTTGRSAYRNGVPIGDVTSPTGVPGSTTAESPFNLTSVDIGGILEDLAQWIIDALVHAFGQIIGTFEELLKVITEPLTRLTDGSFTKWVEELLQKTFDLIGDGTFAKFVEELFDGVFGIITDGTFAKFVEELFTQMWDAITGLKFATFLEELFSFIEDMTISAVDFLTELMKPIVGLGVQVIDFLSSLFKPIQNMASVDVGDFLSSLFEPIQDMASVDVGSWIEEAIVKPIQTMADVDILDWVDNILFQPVKNLTVGLIDYFTAILYPILSIGEVDFGAYIGMVLWPIYNLTMEVVDFIAALFDPIFRMADVSPLDFITNLFKPIEDLALDITDWITEILTNPLSELNVDPGNFLTKLLEPITNIGDLDGTAIVDAILSPLEGIGNLDIAEWIAAVLEAPINAMGAGSLQDIVDAFFEPWEGLNGSLDDLLDIIKAPFNGLAGALDDILDIITEPFKDLSGSLSDLIDIISAPFDDLTGSLSDLIDIISAPFDSLEGGLSDIVDILSSPFSSAEGGISDIIGIIKAPFEGVKGFLSDILGVLSDPFDSLTGSLGDLLDVISAPFKDLKGSIGDLLSVLSKPFDSLRGTLDNLLSIVQAPFKNLTGTLDNLLSVVSSPFKNLTGTLDNLLSIISNPFKNLTGSLSNLLSIIKKPWDYLSGATLDQLLNIIKNPFNNLRGSLSNLLDIVKAPFLNLSGSMSDMLKIIENAVSRLSGDVDLADIGQTIIDAITFKGVTYDLLGKVTQALGNLFGKASEGGIKLLYNPFNQFGIGPEYFLEFAKGGSVPEFADGGYLFGASHSEGGIPGVIKSRHGDVPIEMEGGEYIINKKATKNIGLAALDQLNSMTGNMKVPESLKFEGGGTTTQFEGTKHIANRGSVNNLTGENGGGFTKNSFSVLKFYEETGGTIRDIIGHHGIDIDLRVPDIIEQGKANPSSFVRYFSKGGVVSPIKFAEGGGTGGWSDLSSTEQQQIRERVTDQYSGSDSDTLYKPFNSYGNDAVGRVSLEVGAKDRMTKPVFNGMYEPPPWVPDWVKEAIEEAGEAVANAISDPIGFVENISNQVGSVIEDISSAIGSTINFVFDDVLNMGGIVDSFFPGGGNAPPRDQISAATDAVFKWYEQIRNYWFPDDPRAVASIAGVLQQSMSSEGINEIEDNMNYVFDDLYPRWAESGYDNLFWIYEFGRAGRNKEQNTKNSFQRMIAETVFGTSDQQRKTIKSELISRLIGGTALAKSFAYDGRFFDPNTRGGQYVPNTGTLGDVGSARNPFVAGLTSTDTNSSWYGPVKGILEAYGENYSDKTSAQASTYYLGNSTYDFLGGWDSSDPGYFAKLFGRSGKENYASINSGNTGGMEYSDYRGDANSYYQEYANAVSTWWLRDIAATYMYDLAAEIFSWASSQENPFDLFSLNMDKVRMAPSYTDYKGNVKTHKDYNAMSNWFQNLGDHFLTGWFVYPEAWQNATQSTNRNSDVKKANGGYLIGPSHSNGGMPIEAEGGEYVMSKKAVNSIGVENLDRLNFGGGVLLDVPKFPEGGVVVGRRDYDPLLAQAITEQYRNTDLEGGTYEQIQSIYNAISGTGLSGDTAATLTEIFGAPQGFWDQINFEGLTEPGITNSIIDGISDVFDETGGTGGSYPVTVVSEEMYLMYMTRPLDAVIVTADNYLDYMTDPLPSNVYQSSYLSSIFKPIYEMGEVTDEDDYLDRLFDPVAYLKLDSERMTDAFAGIVSETSVNSEAFSQAVIKIIEDTVSLTLDPNTFLTYLMSPISELEVNSQDFSNSLTSVLARSDLDDTIISNSVANLFDRMIVDDLTEAEYLSYVLKPILDADLNDDILTNRFLEILQEIIDQILQNSTISNLFAGIIIDNALLNQTISDVLMTAVLNNDVLNTTLSNVISGISIDQEQINTTLTTVLGNAVIDNSLFSTTLSSVMSTVVLDQEKLNTTFNDLVISAFSFVLDKEDYENLLFQPLTDSVDPNDLYENWLKKLITEPLSTIELYGSDEWRKTFINDKFENFIIDQDEYVNSLFDKYLGHLRITELDYLDFALRPIHEIRIADSVFWDRFVEIFSDVDKSRLTAVFEQILLAIFDSRILNDIKEIINQATVLVDTDFVDPDTAYVDYFFGGGTPGSAESIDSIIGKYINPDTSGTGGATFNNDFSAGTMALIETLELLWGQGLIVYEGGMNTQYKNDLKSVMYTAGYDVVVDTLDLTKLVIIDDINGTLSSKAVGKLYRAHFAAIVAAEALKSMAALVALAAGALAASAGAGAAAAGMIAVAASTAFTILGAKQIFEEEGDIYEFMTDPSSLLDRYVKDFESSIQELGKFQTYVDAAILLIRNLLLPFQEIGSFLENAGIPKEVLDLAKWETVAFLLNLIIPGIFMLANGLALLNAIDPEVGKRASREINNFIELIKSIDISDLNLQNIWREFEAGYKQLEKLFKFIEKIDLSFGVDIEDVEKFFEDLKAILEIFKIDLLPGTDINSVISSIEELDTFDFLFGFDIDAFEGSLEKLIDFLKGITDFDLFPGTDIESIEDSIKEVNDFFDWDLDLLKGTDINSVIATIEEVVEILQAWLGFDLLPGTDINTVRESLEGLGDELEKLANIDFLFGVDIGDVKESLKNLDKELGDLVHGIAVTLTDLRHDVLGEFDIGNIWYSNVRGLADLPEDFADRLKGSPEDQQAIQEMFSVQNPEEMFGQIRDGLFGDEESLRAKIQEFGDFLFENILGEEQWLELQTNFQSQIDGFISQFEGLWEKIISELSGGIDKAIYSLRDNLLNGIEEFFSNFGTIFSDLIEKATKALVEGAVMELFKFVGGLVPNPFYKNPYVSGDLHNRKNLLELTIGGQKVQGELGEQSAEKMSEDKDAASKANGGLLYQNGGYAYGPSHAQGGIPGIVAGSTPIEFEGGEYIVNKKTVSLLGDAFFDIVNSIKNPSDASALFAEDGLKLPVNKIFDMRAQLGGFPKRVSNTAFGFSGVGAGLNIASPGYFGTVRKNGGIVKYSSGDKVKSFLPDRFKLLDINDMLSYGEAATLGLLRKDGGPVKKFFGGGLTDLFGGAAEKILSPPRVNLSAGLDLFKGPWTSYGLSWEEGGLVNPIGGGSTNYGFGMMASVNESSSLNASLLRELIQTLRDKDLSVTVVDDNGNKKDESSIKIKRRNQLEYRNASELA